ncbi:DUF982 domain-containing protein [Starkeya sp. ORNL1]|uniref:DUF982 domain-containing protein n=1 Tax=Starkeya sp. ORNL1 TaxID=2709380 RepID=UPI0014639C42|nr:DUF982 domain-containing protein [Starkeya sp. ORNL1]QJP14650.1 DUF982 domain-containing protein [Starkeya sp. ORNL1]
MRMLPVWVLENRQTELALDDVRTAMSFLIFDWPDQFCGTHLHLSAQVIGLAALEGAVSVAFFRAAFVDAADEADILAAGAEPPPLLSFLLASRKRYNRRGCA